MTSSEAPVEVVPYWFCKPSPVHRTHHLHLIPIGSSQWLRVIAFRDHLRAHPETARDYAALKRRLAIEHHFDREAYTDAKGPFIDRITELALQAADGPTREGTSCRRPG